MSCRAPRYLLHISRDRTIKLLRCNGTHAILENSVKTSSVIGLSNLGLLPNGLTSDVGTKDLLLGWMNSGLDDVQLGVNVVPP